MFISVLDLFKVGIGPSSSHTMGPMVAANNFLLQVKKYIARNKNNEAMALRCTLKGSLAFTGKGHATDKAITLGLHGYTPASVANEDLDTVNNRLWNCESIVIDDSSSVRFSPKSDIVFDRGKPLKEHSNGMIFDLISDTDDILLSEIYFSIGGGFVSTQAEINQLVAPLKMQSSSSCPYAFDTASSMLQMSVESGLSIAEMKWVNELEYHAEEVLKNGLDVIWDSMQRCIKNGLTAEGILPGGLGVVRRAQGLYQQLKQSDDANLNDWLCAYAMAVNEENAAGHMVVTAPTNGAAGVIPAVLYYFVKHEGGTLEQVKTFLLTASAIGGLIKHLSSISGAEVGCQGEVGSAAAMAAAGLCAARGGSTEQIENAAEIALEHHLGMTCDPVKGLVQVPCIERNGFGAIKAHTAASLALHGSGQHFMPLDACIAAMKKTGEEMSDKYKETALGGLAVSITEC
ncbi:MAG TPA: L-serine ammonia-lyase [Chromatiales bacterium]|nr:L-serine ammonia-lyase [Thiotrichales bacterium]HIP67512.1 L-serine ammonia-lyase [Chromatiales bacterium]